MYDCLVVGGGVIGLSLAYDLAIHDLRVLVIDRGEIGREASWAGAGILPPAHTRTAVHPLDCLRGLSFQLHAQWAETLRAETGMDNGYRRCGGIYLARSAGEAASLGGLVELLRAEDIRVEALPPSQLAAWEPELHSLVEAGGVKAAYLLPEESQLRNPAHLRALFKACLGRGVDFREHVEIQSFTIAEGKLSHVVQTSGERIAAERFCITAGAWTRMLLQQLGFDNGIMPVRGQIVLYRCARPVLTRILNEGPRYLVSREDGRLLVGSTEEEVGFDKRTTAEGLAELKELACTLLPVLRAAEVEKCWAGLRPGSFDGFPYLGQIPGLQNAFVAAGHFRSGLLLSTGTAVVMSRLIRGDDPLIDLSPFRVGRG